MTTQTEARELAQRFGVRMCDENGNTHDEELYCLGLDDIIELKEALTQPEQEPVAYGMWDTMIGYGGHMMMVRLDKGQDGCTVPLYTTPPQRKPLTDEEINDIAKNYALNNPTTPLHFARAIEAAHGIKGEA